MKRVLEFSPNKMHPWTLSTTLSSREQFLLLTKSIVPSKPAETGIFNVRNASCQGFQQGNPQVRPDSLLLNLYYQNGSIEILPVQKYYGSPGGVTQSEINRIVQTLHRSQPNSRPQQNETTPRLSLELHSLDCPCLDSLRAPSCP